MVRIIYQTSPNNPNRCAWLGLKNMRTKVNTRYFSQSSSSEEDQSSVHMKRSKPTMAPSEQDHPHHDPDPLNNQKWRPLGTFLTSLTPGKLCPGLPLRFWVCMKNKANRSLGQEAPQLCSHIKDAFENFEQDFLASNLPEGKYIKPLPSTSKW